MQIHPMERTSLSLSEIFVYYRRKKKMATEQIYTMFGSINELVLGILFSLFFPLCYNLTLIGQRNDER